MTKTEKLSLLFLTTVIILLFIAICVYIPKLIPIAIILPLAGFIFGMLAGLSR